MSIFAICSDSIDWSATGSMLGGIASLATFFIALCAFKNWKKGIDLQDRYQNIEALARSFILVMRAGYDWQMACGSGENRDIYSRNESPSAWLSAHWQYQQSWHFVRPLLKGGVDPDALFLPENIKKIIVKAGVYLANREDCHLFISDMDSLYQNGLNAIYALRNAP